MRMSKPASSSTTRMRDCFTSCLMRPVHRRHEQQRHKQSEPADRLGELVAIDRLLDVHIAAELMAAIDLSRVVRRRQHDDGELSKFGVRLDSPQNLYAVDLGHPYVEQNQVHLAVPAARSMAPVEQEIENGLPVAEMLDLVVQSGCLEILADEDGVALVVFDNENHEAVVHAERAVFGGAGRETRKVDPTPGALSTQILPFCRSRTRWAIVNPRPSPAPVSGFSR